MHASLEEKWFDPNSFQLKRALQRSSYIHKSDAQKTTLFDDLKWLESNHIKSDVCWVARYQSQPTSTNLMPKKQPSLTKGNGTRIKSYHRLGHSKTLLTCWQQLGGVKQGRWRKLEGG
jgi:hypothetical protein